MIYYVGFYDREDDPSRRMVSQAAVDKMDYIAQKLRRYDEVTIVSASQTTVGNRIFPGRHVPISEGISYKTFFTVGWSRGSLVALEVFFKRLQLLLYLLTHCGSDCNVVVYHSLITMKAIMLARRLRRFHLILEVEEIYQDVVDISKRRQAQEFRMFDCADAYIFSTEYLKKRLNQKRKPYCVVYGNYALAGTPLPSDDGRTHLLFGGNLEESKGALLAAQAATTLPPSYILHIAGVGPPSDMAAIHAVIERNAADTATADIVYEGNLTESAYEALLRRCSIGLCSQDPTAAYSETSFPSKVLNYLRHGLKVVSIGIPTILHSKIAPAIYFYHENSTEALAQCIRDAAQQPAADNAVLKNLDASLQSDIMCVLKEMRA